MLCDRVGCAGFCTWLVTGTANILCQPGLWRWCCSGCLAIGVFLSIVFFQSLLVAFGTDGVLTNRLHHFSDCVYFGASTSCLFCSVAWRTSFPIVAMAAGIYGRRCRLYLCGAGAATICAGRFVRACCDKLVVKPPSGLRLLPSTVRRGARLPEFYTELNYDPSLFAPADGRHLVSRNKISNLV